MAESIHVRSVQEIEALQRETARFIAAAVALTRRIHLETERSEAWVQRLGTSWANDVDARASDVNSAISALDACLSDDDEYMDCSMERRALADARLELKRSQRNLDATRSWSRYRIAPSLNEMEARTKTLDHRLVSDLQASAQNLIRYTESLRETAGQKAGSGSISAAHSGGNPQHRYFAPASASSAPARAAGHSPDDLAPVGSPHGSINGMHLYQQGFRMVPVAAIDDRDNHVTGPQDFSKVSYSEMESGMKRLVDGILPLVQGGADDDFFKGADQRRGLAYPDGDHKVYSAFFSPDPSVHITLDYQNGQYTVNNGRHRIYLARQLGITHLPAQVTQLSRR